MVFQHDIVTKYFAKDRNGLVDDRGKRDGVYYAIEPVCFGVVEREAE
jgi:hypothetical protein